jgi:hypothetical protein
MSKTPQLLQLLLPCPLLTLQSSISPLLLVLSIRATVFDFSVMFVHCTGLRAGRLLLLLLQLLLLQWLGLQVRALLSMCLLKHLKATDGCCCVVTAGFYRPAAADRWIRLLCEQDRGAGFI